MRFSLRTLLLNDSFAGLSLPREQQPGLQSYPIRQRGNLLVRSQSSASVVSPKLSSASSPSSVIARPTTLAR